MLPKSRKLKWCIACAGILVICVLLWDPLYHALYAVQFALGLQKLASGADPHDTAVIQTKVHRQSGGQDYEALVYTPGKSRATRAVVIMPGLSELGCYHPRLIALSRFLAGKGLMVIAPDIREFRDFQISVKPIDQILFWHSQAPTIEGGERVQKTGLAGISYSGTLALIAAARPEVRNKVCFVIAVGPYSSLLRCTKDWFAATSDAAASENYPTRFYAKWIIMLSALDMLAQPEDRSFLHQVIDNLLLQKKVPPSKPGLSAEGVRWYALATMKPNQSDPELAAEIQEHLISAIYPQLDPETALKKIRCPVFLIHGAYDDLIPPGESIELHRKIVGSHLLISPLLTHTHPTGNPLLTAQKLQAAWDSLVFCYQLSRVLL